MSINNSSVTVGKPAKIKPKKGLIGILKSNWQLYLLLALPCIYIIVFHYIPMLGIQIAFKNYNVVLGMAKSKWVGFVHFERFFKSYQFWLLLKNTLGLSIYNLLVNTPITIMLALCLNYLGNKYYKKTVQMITYAPHFISTVVVVGILTQALSLRTGFVNNFIDLIGGERINFMGIPQYFKSLYVWSSAWQEAGWGSIIYLAALVGVDPQLHEAAIMDGASKVKRIWHIDIPSILPTVIILLIMHVGKIMNVGFQKVLLMQNPMNLEASDIIDTYVYTIGLTSGIPNYSYATAIGLFKSIIGLILVVTVNNIAKRVNETSLW